MKEEKEVKLVDDEIAPVLENLCYSSSRKVTAMPLKLTLPMSVSWELRAVIKGAYENAILDVDENDEVYIRAKILRVVARLGAQGEWLSDLARISYSLFQLMETEELSLKNGDSTVKRSILAALLYLCNPWDIIPDHTPSTGYVDDALVMNHCISGLKTSSPDLYRELEEIASSRRMTSA